MPQDHLFRHQAGQMIATLTRIFGPRHIDLAEEVVQEALIKALQQWPYRGVPENPLAWLIQVSKNRALDLLRRETSLQEKSAEIIRAFAAQEELVNQRLETNLSSESLDDTLGMIFMACHPAASSYELTDWAEIVRLYDLLVALNPSPVVALNRAVAVAKWRGLEAGIRAIEEIVAHPAMQHYYLLPATLGELWSEMGDAKRAAGFYHQALNYPCSEPERRFPSKRLEATSRA